MAQLRAPRFFGDARLAKCLEGEPVESGNTTAEPHVARLQQALNDDGILPASALPLLSVDGLFGVKTLDAVNAYRKANGLTPLNGKVDAAMMAHLDGRFAFDLVRAAEGQAQQSAQSAPQPLQASLLPGKIVANSKSGDEVITRFDFENGQVVQVASVRATFVPAVAQAAAQAAEPTDVPFGPPIGQPILIGGTRLAIEFTRVTFIFDVNPLATPHSFTLSRAFWEASISGFELVGRPLSGPEPVAGVPDATIVPHQKGVVLGYPEMIPQPLPTNVYNRWLARQKDGPQLGPPAGFAYLSTDQVNPVYPFRHGTLPDDGVGPVL